MKVNFEIPDQDERGVSPVIGVILMVAITVILAAVIASFVLGFGDSVSENVQAGVDVSENDDGTAGATWISEGNAVEVNVTAAGSDPVTLEEVGQTATIELDSSQAESYNATSGNTLTLGGDTTRTVQVTVTAIGSGGSKTVVTQEEVELEDA
ncbi:type IV pilin [Halobacterium sp. R2-5]|uniref:type IV pilin n=1 Tax=Halobacterium sp. R2-5 TaxID=2715751 RepID=UPI0014240D17|nr:type IV pilin [Halobacterium sp. R2-5]NIC01077.1 type IV pilin [Halobacterium sp. R2-5]